MTVGGRTLLEHACARFVGHGRIGEVVIVVPPAHVESAAELVPFATVVSGGPTRQESVARGLAALAEHAETVLVHDVARAFAPGEVIDRVLDALAAGADAVVPTVPLADTIRSMDGKALGPVVDRSRLVAVQTPQGFSRAVLAAAHASADPLESTDDASLVETYGAQVVAVPGSPDAFKITVPLDLAVAQVVAAGG